VPPRAPYLGLGDVEHVQADQRLRSTVWPCLVADSSAIAHLSASGLPSGAPTTPNWKMPVPYLPANRGPEGDSMEATPIAPPSYQSRESSVRASVQRLTL
jgi:hypothetical protein